MSRVVDLVEEVKAALRVLDQARSVPELSQRANNLLYDMEPLFEQLCVKLQNGSVQREDTDQLIAMLPVARSMHDHMTDLSQGAMRVLH